MSTDTTEKGLETLIFRHLTGVDALAVPPSAPAAAPDSAGISYFAGCPRDFDRAQAQELLAMVQADLRAPVPQPVQAAQ